MGCPQTLVDIALSYAPSDYPSAKYLDGVMPYDQYTEPERAMSYAQPYPKGASSCGLFQIANYARAGFRFRGIGEPYLPLMGQVEEILVAFGNAHGALERGSDPHTWLPGDVFHVNNISHWGMVERVVGDLVYSIDGGQPGIAKRVRRIVKNGAGWALVSENGNLRPVVEVIRAEALNVPCDGISRGWLNFGLFLATAGGAAYLARYLLT